VSLVLSGIVLNVARSKSGAWLTIVVGSAGRSNDVLKCKSQADADGPGPALRDPVEGDRIMAAVSPEVDTLADGTLQPRVTLWARGPVSVLPPPDALRYSPELASERAPVEPVKVK